MTRLLAAADAISDDTLDRLIVVLSLAGIAFALTVPLFFPGALS